MHRFSIVVALAAGVGLVVPPVAASQPPSGLVVRAVRFYRAEQNQTRVTAFVQIPLSFMEPTREDEGGQLSYQVTVRVADSTGMRIAPEQVWRSHPRADVGDPGAYTIEMLDFAVVPGRYRLDVSVVDSVSGKRVESGTDIQGFAEPPPASDLLLSPQMRLATGGDTIPKPGELRRGNTLITASALLELTPLRSKIFYLLEAYTPQDDHGTMEVAIIDSTGRVLQKTRPAPVQVAAGGSVLQGGLDLVGLPSGQYTMTVTVNVGGKSGERSAQFVMGDLATALVRDSVQRVARRNTDEGYFAVLDEAQLDEAEAPLGYVAESGELSVYKSGLSLSAKREFLARFWAKRDPTPGTPRNEERERFYGMISFANTAFRETGRSTVPGWRTDRGRIYARNGTPSDTLIRRNAGTAPPYMVWRYERGKTRYYVFVDRTGLGTYALVYSNDLKEAGLPGWQDLLGPDAVKDVGQFLNIDFFDPNRSNF